MAPKQVLVLVLVLQMGKSFCWEVPRSQPLAANGVQRARARANACLPYFNRPSAPGRAFPGPLVRRRIRRRTVSADARQY